MRFVKYKYLYFTHFKDFLETKPLNSENICIFTLFPTKTRPDFCVRPRYFARTSLRLCRDTTAGFCVYEITIRLSPLVPPAKAGGKFYLRCWLLADDPVNRNEWIPPLQKSAASGCPHLSRNITSTTLSPSFE